MTGTELVANTEWLASAPPLTLQWRGRDAAEAWAQVLADDVGYALQCRAGRCRLWVLDAGVGAGAVAAAAPHR